jgi:hypothetical protein
MWYVFQLLIIGIVVALAQYWIPNPRGITIFIVVCFAAGIAIGATKIVGALTLRLREKKSSKRRHDLLRSDSAPHDQ